MCPWSRRIPAEPLHKCLAHRIIRPIGAWSACRIQYALLFIGESSEIALLSSRCHGAPIVYVSL